MQLARRALAPLAWLFLGLLIVQVFLAGVGLFGAGRMSFHVDLGFTLGALPLLILAVAAIGRVGRRLLGLTALLAVLTAVQTLLPGFRGAMPFVAALHPLNAVVLIVVTATIARRASRQLSEPAGQARPSDEPASGTVLG